MQIFSRTHSLLISSATLIYSTLCSSLFKVSTDIKACFLHGNFFLWLSLSSNIPTQHLSILTMKKSAVNKLQNLLPGMLQLVITRKCNHIDKSAITTKGTRAFHYFKPVGATRLDMKRISDDKQFSLRTEQMYL